MKKVKAYSYLRISTETQKYGDGIRRQLEASEKYARDNDYELVDSIRDLGVSGFRGKNAKEGAFAEFLYAIERGKVSSGSVLIVESLDRLSRDGATKAFSQFAGILAKGITIVTLLDGQKYTEESVNSNAGQLFTSLGIMIRANDESETKSKRLKAAWYKKRENIAVKKMTRRMPAWLDLNEDRTTFLVKKDATDTVKKIYNLCINGMGIYSIARNLNGNLDRYPPISSANRWNNSYISKILHNRAVMGHFQANRMVNGKRLPIGEPIENYYPEIISEDLFFLAQSSLKERRTGSAGRKGNGNPNLFTNLAKCGGCGGAMIFRNKGKPPKGGEYLRCHNAILNSGCNKPNWRYSEFESAFYKFVQEVSFSEILDSDKFGQLSRLEDKRAVKNEQLNEKKEAFNAIISRITNSSLSVEVVSALDDLGHKVNLEIKEIENQLNLIEIDIAEQATYDARADQADFILEYEKLIQSMTRNEIAETRFQLQNILKKSIASISIYNGAELGPWELRGNLSDKLQSFLTDKGMTSDIDLENFFSSDYGRRVYDHSERYFVVRFKNGVERVVRPFFDHSMITVTEKLANLRSKPRIK
jgi:DNA invertase Pin-like site-specific DNA recombinase